jgi:3-oxoadipate CoA-transferase beta subunit
MSQSLLKPITRNEIAQKIASMIPEGAYVNLGIGMPTLVANYLPKDKEIFFEVWTEKQLRTLKIL